MVELILGSMTMLEERPFQLVALKNRVFVSGR
jgi:hypothetical protein